MNMKVVIVWAFAIVIIGGIGLFGWMNQDLLIEEGPNIPYNPAIGGEGTSSKTCYKNLENGSSYTYGFNIDDATASISNFTATFNERSASLEKYEAASKLQNTQITGFTASIIGGVSSFQVQVTVNINTLDTVGLAAVSNELNLLEIVVEKNTDYNSYKTAIERGATTPTYICN